MLVGAGGLYARWQELAGERGERAALRDVRGGRVVSFRDLASTAHAEPKATGPLVVEASGMRFLLDVLRSWRDGVPLVPLDPGAGFDSGRLAGMPMGTSLVKQTSGSTGEPRLVLFTAGQIAADASQVVNTMRLNAYGWNLQVISMAHSYGFSNLVLPLLLHGVPLMIGQGPLPAAVQQALVLGGSRVILPAVPAMWQAWHAAGILDSAQIGLAISAGAPLAGDLERDVYASSGVKLHNFYGSSECGGIAFDRTPTPRDDSQWIGTPLHGVRVERASDGHLRVFSSAVGTGYWPPRADVEFGEGRFVTGDRGEIEPGGGIILSGRSGDAINVAGRKVSPQQIEEAISGVPGVMCCVVFGVPSEDPQRVEDIVACVNTARPLNDLKEAVAIRLEAGCLPRKWWVNQDLNADSRGKISRAEWKKHYRVMTGR